MPLALMTIKPYGAVLIGYWLLPRAMPCAYMLIDFIRSYGVCGDDTTTSHGDRFGSQFLESEAVI